MHEFSVAQSILQAVAEVRITRRLGPVRRVTIELGEFSGVEAALLRSAFDELAEHRPEGRTELVIESAPLEALCVPCQTPFRVVDFQFQCPRCDSADVQIVRGEELKLLSITAESVEAITCPL